jgi:hypothetical protein
MAGFFVPLQVRLPGKRFPANIADIALHVVVEQHVLSQTSRPLEDLVANLTSMFPRDKVQAPVRFQGAGQGVTPIANVANVVFLACMSKHVDFQLPLLHVALPANFTDLVTWEAYMGKLVRF